MQFLTGALPAEYGLRTAGVFNITTRAFATPGGDIGIYGGSRQTIMPSFDYGGSFGKTEYFVAGQGNWNDLGIESAIPKNMIASIMSPRAILSPLPACKRPELAMLLILIRIKAAN